MLLKCDVPPDELREHVIRGTRTHDVTQVKRSEALVVVHRSRQRGESSKGVSRVGRTKRGKCECVTSRGEGRGGRARRQLAGGSLRGESREFPQVHSPRLCTRPHALTLRSALVGNESSEMPDIPVRRIAFATERAQVDDMVHADKIELVRVWESTPFGDREKYFADVVKRIFFLRTCGGSARPDQTPYVQAVKAGEMLSLGTSRSALRQTQRAEYLTHRFSGISRSRTLMIDLYVSNG